jgi:glycosyltransferase involved in cell wall biosynthesis
MKSSSVILPTHNKARYLDITLASYERQTERNFELIIVDDGSNDDTPEVIARYTRRLPIKHQRTDNRGRSAARNRAIALAEGELLVFSDDDRVVEPGFIEAHVSSFASRDDLLVMGWQHGIITLWRPDLPLDPLLLWRFVSRGTLSDTIRDGQPVQVVSAEDVRDRLADTLEKFGLEERWWIEGCLPVLQRYGHNLDGFAVPWILGTTGNMSCSRRAVIECGAFDEAYRGWGLEDLDICYRLHHAGLKSLAVEAALSHHQAHLSAAKKRHSWLANLLHFLHKYDVLDAALYAYYFTRAHVVNMHEFNQLYLTLQEEEPPPVLRRALLRGYREIATARVRSLEASSGGGLLGVVQDEW